MELPGLPPDRYHWRTPLANVVTSAAIFVVAAVTFFRFGPRALLPGLVAGAFVGFLLSVGLIYLLYYLFSGNRN
jgi:hypothetical protein